MRNDKIVVSMCPEGTDTVFALSAGGMLAACVEQKRPEDPLYALLPKLGVDAGRQDILSFRPDVVLLPRECDPQDLHRWEQAGVEAIPVGADTLEGIYDNIRRIGRALGRAAEAEKAITKARYGFSLLKAQVEGTEKIRTAFFTSKHPYAVAGGGSAVNELLALDGLENVYGDINRAEATPDLSTLRIAGVQLVLLPDYPQAFDDEDAIRIGNHTEHALTVFVPGELLRGGAPIARLPRFFERLNEKIRRFSDDSLAERDKPTYF